MNDSQARGSRRALERIRYATSLRLAGVALASIAIPVSARADVVWPALLLENRIVTWWAIAAGLLVEWPVARHITGRTWQRSLWPNLAMNLVSTSLGVVLIPLAGFIWELIPEFTIYRWFRLGTFNPFGWGATLVLATLINAFLEAFVLRRFFRAEVRRKGLLLLFIANLASVGMAMVSVLVWPPPT